MPVPKKFRVSLYKAKEDNGFISIELDLGGRNGLPQRVPVEGTLNDALAVARRLANEYGKPCQASISVAKGERKPPGFDAVTRGLFFNMDKAEATEETAAA